MTLPPTAVAIGLLLIFPIAILLFSLLPPRRAVIATLLTGWCFLPHGAIVIRGFPDFDRLSAPALAILLCILLFDSQRLLAFRFTIWDLPMIVYTISPLLTAISADLGLKPGISAMTSTLTVFGLPYLFGRLYIRGAEGFKDLALGIFIAGVVYVPLCLLEVRLSPMCHKLVYGFRPTRMVHLKRYGGYKPLVFMQGGVMLGFWMALATAVGAWAAFTRRKLFGVSTGLLVVSMIVTTALCRSIAALVMLMMALGCLVWVRYVRTWTPIWVIVIAIPVYAVLRIMGLLETEVVQGFALGIFDENRAGSLWYRLTNEDLVIEKVLQRPLLGWGSGKAHVFDPVTGAQLTVIDGFWVITLGERGFVGLSAFLASALLPVVLVLTRAPARMAFHPTVAPAVGLATAALLFSVDCLPNATLNPVVPIIWGALGSSFSWAFQPRQPAGP